MSKAEIHTYANECFSTLYVLTGRHKKSPIPVRTRFGRQAPVLYGHTPSLEDQYVTPYELSRLRNSDQSDFILKIASNFCYVSQDLEELENHRHGWYLTKVNRSNHQMDPCDKVKEF